MQSRIIKDPLGYYVSALFLGIISTIFMIAGLILLIGAITYESLNNWRGIKEVIIASGIIAISISVYLLIFWQMLPIAKGLKNKESWALRRAEKIRLRWFFR